MRKLNLRPWKSPPPVHLLKPGEIRELEMAWPAYRDDAYIDQLTGLPNRRAFDTALSVAVKEATAQGRSFALLIFDLDFFKAVNDTAGHLAGDAVLREFARRMLKTLRSTDFCARFGGEEFCVLTIASGKVRELGERVRLALKQLPVSVRERQPVAITCSFGYAVFPFDAVDGEELLKRADNALYDAKEAGRDRGAQYTENTGTGKEMT